MTPATRTDEAGLIRQIVDGHCDLIAPPRTPLSRKVRIPSPLNDREKSESLSVPAVQSRHLRARKKVAQLLRRSPQRCACG